jgi:hypothetical protein
MADRRRVALVDERCRHVMAGLLPARKALNGCLEVIGSIHEFIGSDHERQDFGPPGASTTTSSLWRKELKIELHH